MIEVVLVCIIGIVLVNCFSKDEKRRAEDVALLKKIMKWAIIIGLSIMALALIPLIVIYSIPFFCFLF